MSMPKTDVWGVWSCRFAYIARKGIQVLQDKFKVQLHTLIHTNHTPMHS